MTDVYLTPVETEIHDLLKSGKNLADIVHVTGIAPIKVKAHVESIRQKLGLSDLRINKSMRNEHPLHLSPAEARVFDRLLRGLSNKQIALELFVTEKTVKFHVTSIYKILGVRSRAQFLVKYADWKRDAQVANVVRIHGGVFSNPGDMRFLKSVVSPDGDLPEGA